MWTGKFKIVIGIPRTGGEDVTMLTKVTWNKNDPKMYAKFFG